MDVFLILWGLAKGGGRYRHGLNIFCEGGVVKESFIDGIDSMLFL